MVEALLFGNKLTYILVLFAEEECGSKIKELAKPPIPRNCKK